MLAIAGAVSVLRDRRRALGQFLVFYTVFLTAAYCAIPYKTPWCALGFLHGLILLAGVGAVALVEISKRRAVRVPVIALLTVALAHLGWQAWRASYPLSADRTNPYAYAQTSSDILTIVRQVEGVAGRHPDGNGMIVKVMAPEHDYGPLLWYLRGFTRVGWWDHLPADPFAPVIVVSADLNARLDESSDGAWLMAGMSELRPGRFLELYVESEAWRAYIMRQTGQEIP
jgi:predicted membrane-bound mannosyltransferase